MKTENIIRPAINFGNNLLFSGTILTKDNNDIIVRGKFYNVMIEMPTVEEDGYTQIQELVQVGNEFTIQNASRIIGRGEIVDYIFL